VYETRGIDHRHRNLRDCGAVPLTTVPQGVRSSDGMASKKKKAAPSRKSPAKSKKAAPKKAAPRKAAPKKAKAKPAPRVEAKAKPAPKAKARPAPKARAKALPNPVASAAEKQVAQLLADYESGNIDNAWDVVHDLHELDGVLPKTSPLRKRFDVMSSAIQEICRTS